MASAARAPLIWTLVVFVCYHIKQDKTAPPHGQIQTHDKENFMDGLKQKAKYTLFGVKIIALIFALWIVIFNDPVVEVVAENQFYIADTNWLMDTADYKSKAIAHCQSRAQIMSGFEAKQRYRKGSRINRYHYHFRCG